MGAAGVLVSARVYTASRRREKVRVARALEVLPKISAELARGAISYSKVRAMTRIATPENEAELVNLALHGTASHIAKLVRKYRWLERVREAEQANEAHRTRQLYFFYDDDGSMIIHARLPQEVGAVVKKAIEVAVEALEREESDQSGEQFDQGQSEERDTASSSSTKIRTQSNDSAEACDSPWETDAPDAPGMTSAARTDRTMTAEDEHEAANNHRHARMFEPYSARRADALSHLAECFLAAQSQCRGATADRYQVVIHIDQRLLASPSNGSPTNASSRCEIEDDLEAERPLAIETARRLGCDCSVVGIVETAEGEPLNVGRKMRSIPPALRRALKARDGGCRYPGCGRTRFTDSHHVKHWADGGETKLSNLATLRTFHHRLIHEGGFGVRVTGMGDFEFTRPDGSRVEPNGSVRSVLRRPSPLDDALPPEAPPACEPAVFALNRERGLAIDAQTSRCRWGGERMDYGMAIECLLQYRSEPAHASVPREPSGGALGRAVSSSYETDDIADAVDHISTSKAEQRAAGESCESAPESAEDAELPACLRCWTETSPEYLKFLAELGIDQAPGSGLLAGGRSAR